MLAKALGNLLGLLMFCFKRVNQVQANKVGHFDLDRHGAAVGSARVAHTGLVARPTFNAVYVDDASGGSHMFLFFNCEQIQSIQQFVLALLRAMPPNIFDEPLRWSDMKLLGFVLVAWTGIEPVTRGFTVIPNFLSKNDE